jgi:hypothetical protein
VDKLLLGMKYLGTTALGRLGDNGNIHAASIYEGGFREPEGETTLRPCVTTHFIRPPP